MRGFRIHHCHLVQCRGSALTSSTCFNQPGGSTPTTTSSTCFVQWGVAVPTIKPPPPCFDQESFVPTTTITTRLMQQSQAVWKKCLVCTRKNHNKWRQDPPRPQRWRRNAPKASTPLVFDTNILLSALSLPSLSSNPIDGPSLSLQNSWSSIFKFTSPRQPNAFGNKSRIAHLGPQSWVFVQCVMAWLWLSYACLYQVCLKASSRQLSREKDLAGILTMAGSMIILPDSHFDILGYPGEIFLGNWQLAEAAGAAIVNYLIYYT